jgi:hypothetical protein
MVQDSLLGLNVELNISKYKNGWAAEDIAEASAVLSLVATKFFGMKGAGDLPPVFQIGNSPKVDPTERFSCASIRRAFGSRGSPDEMRDALRIAVLVGRNGRLSPKQYAESWFGQDCNSFASNYLGLSPFLAIGAFATGVVGTHNSELDSKPFLPLPPRNDETADLWGVEMGDPLITFGDPDSRGIPWRHIAIVQDLNGSFSAATLHMAEWGEKGGKPQHNHGPYTVNLIPNLLDWKPDPGWEKIHGALKRAMPGMKLLGFRGKTPDLKPAFRIFFGQGKTTRLAYRGWHTGDFELGH